MQKKRTNYIQSNQCITQAPYTHAHNVPPDSVPIAKRTRLKCSCRSQLFDAIVFIFFSPFYYGCYTLPVFNFIFIFSYIYFVCERKKRKRKQKMFVSLGAHTRMNSRQRQRQRKRTKAERKLERTNIIMYLYQNKTYFLKVMMVRRASRWQPHSKYICYRALRYTRYCYDCSLLFRFS